MNTVIPSRPIRSTSSQHEVHAGGRFVRAGLAAGLAAAATNVAVVATARSFEVPMRVKGEAIPLVAFPQLTLIASVIAVGLAAVLGRRSHQPRQTFLRTTVVLTALFVVPPILADATTSTKLVLELTHLVVAVLVIPTIAARLSGDRHHIANSDM